MNNISKSICLGIYCLICIILSTAPILAAESERRITISDRPLAFNHGHMYYLRVVDDNLSLRGMHLEHHFLIKRDMKTNHVQQHWLVRQLRWGDDWNANDDQSAKRTFALEEPPEILKRTSAGASHAGLLFNPYDILREEGAVTINTLDINAAISELSSWEVRLGEGVTYKDKSEKQKIDQGEELLDVRLSDPEFNRQAKEGVFSTITEMKVFENEKYKLPNDLKFGRLELGSCIIQQELLVATGEASRFLQVECEQFGTTISWFNTWIRVE